MNPEISNIKKPIRSLSQITINNKYDNKSLNIKNKNLDCLTNKTYNSINLNDSLLSNNKCCNIADEHKNYIKDLVRKLQIVKEGRKLAEKNSRVLENRVQSLSNQEKTVKYNNIF